MTRTATNVITAASASMAVAGMLIGCSPEEAGHPAPDAGSAPASGAAPLGGLQACDVLAKAAPTLGQGFPPGQVDHIGSSNGCTSTRTVSAGGGTIGADLSPNAKYNNLPGASLADLHQGQINGRKALLARNGAGNPATCMVSMEVAPDSRATATVTYSPNPSAACDMAQKLAETIEAQLPKAK